MHGNNVLMLAGRLGVGEECQVGPVPGAGAMLASLAMWRCGPQLPCGPHWDWGATNVQTFVKTKVNHTRQG